MRLRMIYLAHYVMLSAPTSPLTNTPNPMFKVTLTETNVSTVDFETEEEAREFMKEPNYDLCDWECVKNTIELD
tara:strand:- start:255 stop:476 length:222 start_codon:yes stop_codon:yes gene_type:complete